MPKPKHVVGERLRERRKAKGLTQRELANLVGLETIPFRGGGGGGGGNGELSVFLMHSLREALDTSGYYLTGVVDNPVKSMIPTLEEMQLLDIFRELDLEGRKLVVEAIETSLELMRNLKRH